MTTMHKKELDKLALEKPSFILLFLLISFGSVTAVLFTPALPQISNYFGVDANTTQWTVTLFLIGYAFGQLIYGPLSNAYGRKMSLYVGIITEIIASIVCALSGYLQAFWLLIIARLFMALGASVGLKMTFTLLADSYKPEEATRITSHLMIAFAITPGLGIAIGGYLTEYLGWQSCFYFLAIYGVLLLYLTFHMQETATKFELKALYLSNITNKYMSTLKNTQLIIGAVLMGCGTAVVYLFAAMAPFVVQQIMHVSASKYGLWNLVPPIGILFGSQLAAYSSKQLQNIQSILLGVAIMILGVISMLLGLHIQQSEIWLFVPLAVIYIGMSFVFPNASTIAMTHAQDKSSASAMMSFINMGIATISVLLINLITIHNAIMIPLVFMFMIVLAIIALIILIIRKKRALLNI